MIYIVDEDVAIRYVAFQLSSNTKESKAILNQDGLGVDLLCDDSVVGFSVTFTEVHIPVLEEIISLLKQKQ